MLSLVICTLNEGTAIYGVICEVSAVLHGIAHEIIVVDDNSQDNTQEQVRRAAEELGNVVLCVRTNERGLASAAIRGWDMAKGKYLGIMDGDGQHDPEAIRQMADIMLRGDVDLACVSRYLGKTATGLGFVRDLGSKAATFATSLVLKAPLSDPMSGCFMMRREYYLSAREKLAGVGFKILVDIVASSREHPRFVEVKAALRQRVGGKSKLDLRVVFDLCALLVEKASGGVLHARFVMFGAVGVSGVFVYGAVLAFLHTVLHNGGVFPLYRYRFGIDDAFSYGIAIFLSMTSNFFVNNYLTFRDQSLRGSRMIIGLVNFYIACSVGSLVSLALALFLKEYIHIHWFVAGISAALIGGVWNYWGARLLSWKK